MQRATAREWMWAKIVLGGGFVIAIAVAAFFALKPAPQPATEAAIPPPASEEQQPATQSQQQQSDAKSAMMVCAQELINAKNIGIVPPDGQLANLMPKDTPVKGRYSCDAATSATQYRIAADLVCRNLQDSRCVQLYNIMTGDGTIIYQRQQN